MNEPQNNSVLIADSDEPDNDAVLTPECAFDRPVEMLYENPYELITRRSNAINFRFACFLLAIRLGDEERQAEEFNNLLWIIGKTSEYKGDWKCIGGLCLTKEIAKHNDLDIAGVIDCANQNGFAYLWLAGQRDFANARQSHWRRERNEQAREESFNYVYDPQSAESTAQELLQITPGLPKQVGVIVECIAEIYRNPESLVGIKGETDTRIRMSLVREAANRLRISEKQVKRYLSSLQNPSTPELSAPKEIMAQAARESQERQHCPVSFPPVSAELVAETAKRMEREFQPYQFYKPLDNKNSTIQDGIPLPSNREHIEE